MDRVWGYEAAFDTGTVTVHVRRLREKIEEDPSAPRHVQTVWGVGYRFVAVIGTALALAAGAPWRWASCSPPGRPPPDLRLRVVALALGAVVLPLGAVLLSGAR